MRDDVTHTYIVGVFRETVLNLVGFVWHNATPDLRSFTDFAGGRFSFCVLLEHKD